MQDAIFLLTVIIAGILGFIIVKKSSAFLDANYIRDEKDEEKY